MLEACCYMYIFHLSFNWYQFHYFYPFLRSLGVDFFLEVELVMPLCSQNKG